MCEGLGTYIKLRLFLCLYCLSFIRIELLTANCLDFTDSLYTEILEVNLFAFDYRLFH